MSGIMEYLSDLIHEQLDHKKAGNIPEGIRVDDLMEIAYKNHIEYLILGALLKTDLTEEITSRLKPIVIQSTIKSMAQVRCLKELEEKFEREGIYHQALKGSVLKEQYPTPEMREMSDIDIMIYDVNLDRAKKVVEDMGFTLFESVKHHDIYMKPPFLILELHHSLYDKDVDKVQYEYFKNKKQLMVKAGCNYALLFGNEDFYVYLIAHMAKHFFETGCGIRNLVDVYYYRQLYEATWDETILTAQLEKCGLTEFEKRIHILTRVWLGGQKPDQFSKILFNYMADCGTYGKGENGLWGQYAMQSNSQKENDLSHAKWWYYFPPITYLERDYPWLKKYPYFLIAAWGIRAVHGLRSKEGREKRKMLLHMKSEAIYEINEIYKGMQLHFKRD